MAGTSGGKGTALGDRLLEEPHAFGFFQAVRLLDMLATETAAAQAAAEGTARPAGLAESPVGAGRPPEDEPVRFRVHQGVTLQPAEIVHWRVPRPAAIGRAAKPGEMTVAFLGLTGPLGVLPLHYSSLVLERRHGRYRDFTLSEFFDLINHRTISFFYRIWEKYRFPFPYERHHRVNKSAGKGGAVDLFTDIMYCITGLGTKHLRGRMAIDDEVVIYYGGLFAQRPRTAVNLRQLLADYFELPIEVEQFVPQWLELPRDNRSSLPSPVEPDGRNCGFGRGMVLGARVLNVEHRLRVRVGPLDYGQFLDFLPSGTGLVPLSQLARLYLGPQFDIEVQLILKAAEIPCAKLEEGGTAGDLGWNTWLLLEQAVEDSGDAVFTVLEFGD